MTLCHCCWARPAMEGLLACRQCWDANQRAAGYLGDDEGRAVRQGESRKAREEELEVSRGTVGGSQGEGQA